MRNPFSKIPNPLDIKHAEFPLYFLTLSDTDIFLFLLSQAQD